MKNNKQYPEYKEEFDSFFKELKENNLFESVPNHIFMMHKPIVGANYFESKNKIMFVGQDSDKINNFTSDSLRNIEKENAIRNYYDWKETFDFTADDNFLNWYYKNRYKFWEFPLRYLNIANGKGNVVLKKDEIMKDESIQKLYQSFGWANLSPIVFPHIYEKKNQEKIDQNTFSKIFNIAQKNFGNINFINKYFEPATIIVLSKHFNEKIFLANASFTKEIIDIKNNIAKYVVDINGKPVNVVATYHPSGMARLYNNDKERLSLAQFVDVIYEHLK
ncbi:MAG: hypothetical protein WCK02_12890 [Bacteroidota bacterium]